MIDAFSASRLVFHLKTDAQIVLPLRHDIVVHNGLIHRYSQEPNPEQALHLEAKLADRLVAAKIPAIPMLLKGPRPHQVMRRVRGKAVAELSIEEKRQVWQQLAKTLRSLHAIKGDKAGLLIDTDPLTGAYSAWHTFIEDRLPEHVFDLLGAGLLDAAAASKILDVFLAWQAPECNSLLHTDLNDWNVFAENGLTDILDWEDAIIGDPVFELAGWCCFTDHPEEEWPLFLDAYYDVRPEGFDRTFWVYYLRIAMSRLLYLHRRGYQDLTKGKARIERALTEL